MDMKMRFSPLNVPITLVVLDFNGQWFVVWLSIPLVSSANPINTG